VRPLHLLAASLCVPLAAEAFCGFYVSGAGGQLFNDASMVVLLRDGTRTVLSMQNNYRGPVEDFALVVPVPVVLQKGNVATLPREAFARLDELTAPRLVEMTTDDCGLGALGTIGRGGGGCPNCGAGMGTGLQRDLGVKVEAKFDVEEYEIVILSAENALGLEIWLKEQKYKIPEGAAPILKPYVQGGSKFFVAKVNAKKARFRDGHAVLSPLRFHYDSDAFSLPVRLGLVNSAGTQDLIVHVIAKTRYELANAKNVLIPTNFDVRTRTQPQWGGFYAELLSRTFKKNPGAAVTEFAWEGALPPPQEWVSSGIYGVTCDPCPPPHPVDNPLAKYLGVMHLPKIKTDEGVAAFARAATVTRLHLRYSKENPPDDLVFKAAEPIHGGVPEAKAPGPAKHNRFQGRYVMWIQCGGGLLGGGLGGGLGFFTAGSPLNRPQAVSDKLIDPFEQLIVADLPELDVKAMPLSKDAPKLAVAPPPQQSQVAMPPPRQQPVVHFGAPHVTGDLDREIVRRVFMRSKAQLTYCYEKARLTNPALAGTLVLKFEITPEGTVAAAEIASSTLASPDVEQCALARSRTWQYPKPADGKAVSVTYPLTFK